LVGNAPRVCAGFRSLNLILENQRNSFRKGVVIIQKQKSIVSLWFEKRGSIQQEAPRINEKIRLTLGKVQLRREF
jgi:hypothetical protein